MIARVRAWLGNCVAIAQPALRVLGNSQSDLGRSPARSTSQGSTVIGMGSTRREAVVFVVSVPAPPFFTQVSLPQVTDEQ